MKKIHLIRPNFSILEETYVLDAMRNGWEDNYDNYRLRFEKEFPAFHDRKFGLFVPHATEAIHLALMTLGIGKDDEVIVPEMTWIASASPIVQCGAIPVFADICKDDWCLDPKSVVRNINPKTKAIIVVDLYGNVAKMDQLEQISKETEIPLIEDAAQAFGAKFKGRRTGNFGTMSVFSFHQSKTLTTGEGGMLLLDDEDLYQKANFLRSHGKSKKKMYFNEKCAWKMLGSNFQAAIGCAQLERHEELIEKKQEIFSYYQENLKDLPDIQMNLENEDVSNGYWLPSIVFPTLAKEEAIDHFSKLEIQTRPFFYPLSSLPAFDPITTWEKNRFPKKNPVAYDLSRRGINLPAPTNITLNEIDRICEEIKKLWK